MAHSRSNKTPVLLLSVLVACAESEPREVTEDPTASAATPSDTSWTVTASAFGPVRFGMSVAEASAALPGGFTRPTASAGCNYAYPAGGPRGVSFMVENAVVVRMDVDSGVVRTAEGAGLGESQVRLRELYQDRITVQPHKYETGHFYFIVRPAASADSGFRIVFETDGSKVTRYRAGLRPPVEYVERCG